MIRKRQLVQLYVKKQKSMQEIAHACRCSLHTVHYWMQRHNIERRSISESIYLKHNPHGDPFYFDPPKTRKDFRLFGMGLGLYWGEGTKSSRNEVRLGNTDAYLIRIFMKFLTRFYRINRNDFRFGLQIFSDMSSQKALAFWLKSLKVSKRQFHPKVIVTRSGSIGTYRKKSPYGVVTVHYHNTKLRNLLNDHLAAVAQG